MTYNEWQESVTCKIRGTWNLHHALFSQELDFFVMFSSISGIIGNRGQANYAAANTFMDAFVLYRRHLGLPASAIDIGLMEDVGAARDRANLVQQLKAQGNHPLHEQDLLDALQLAIADSWSEGPDKGSAQHQLELHSHQLVLGLRSAIPLDDPKNRVIWKRDARFAAYHDLHQSTQRPIQEVSSALETLLLQGSSDPTIFCEASTATALAHEVGLKLADLMLRPEAEIDLGMSLDEVGVDSLMAIEVRSWWKHTFGVEISMLDLLSSGSITALGQKAAQGMFDKCACSNGSDKQAQIR